MVKCVVEMFSNWQLWIKMKCMILENAFSAKYWNHQSTEVENLSIGKKYVCWKGNMLTNLNEKSFLFIWKRLLWYLKKTFLERLCQSTFPWVASFAVTLILIPTIGNYWSKYQNKLKKDFLEFWNCLSYNDSL